MYNKKLEDVFTTHALLDALNYYHKAEDYDDLLEAVNSNRFQKILFAGYVPDPVRSFSIEKNAHEKRELALSSTSSKIIQKILVQELETLVAFSNRSYAYRKNKSTVKAIRRTQDILKSHFWIAKADIDNFFDTIDQEILIQKLNKHIRDKRFIKLISLFISNGMLKGKHWVDKELGVYQGDNLSPLLSNIYLNDFDHYLEEKHIEFIRFADDMIFFAKHRRDAIKVLDMAEGYLNSIGLSFGKEKSYIANRKEGFEYLGLRFKDETIMIDNDRLMKKISKLSQKTKNSDLSKTVAIVNEQIDGLQRYYAKILKDDRQFTQLQEHAKSIIIKKIEEAKRTKTINRKSLFKQILMPLKSYLPMTKSEHLRYIDQLIAKAYESLALEAPLRSAKQEIAKSKTDFLKSQIKHSELLLSRYGLYVGVTKGKIIVKEYGKVVKKLPINQASRIIVMNKGITLSAMLIYICAKHKIDIDFIDQHAPYALITYYKNINNEMHLKQLELKQSAQSLEIAKAIIHAKAKNQINLIKYYARYRKESDIQEFEKLNKKIMQMTNIYKKIKSVKNIESLMGLEGSISTLYWQSFGILIEDENFTRVTFNAHDSINQAINYGYAFIYNRVQAALIKNGINLYYSFFHAEQPNKPTLVYDMVEEFRQPVVDREILSILAKGIKLNSSKGRLTQETIKVISQNIQERLITPTKWRKGKYKITSIIDEQMLSLKLVIQKRQKRYKGFVVRY